MSSLWKNTVGAGLCSIALVAASCADEGSNTTSDGKSVDAATAQLALTELTTNVDTTVSGVNGDASGAAVSVNCAGGGAASVEGRVNVVPVPTQVDVQVAIDYNGCVSNGGTTLAGAIDFRQSVEAGALPVRVQTIYQGDVTFTGKVQAQCTVDLNVLVDEAGKAVSVSGSFCGHDAASLQLQVNPRWSSAT
jgi:hypothetical protein